MDTLPDFLNKDLRIISVGLNPSLPSVRDGYYFSGRRNRFWPALNQSTLLQTPVQPSPEAMEILLQRDRIGFTDTVKRPTAGAGDLRAADYRQWVPLLEEKLVRYQPDVVWFHGKVAFTHYVKFSSLTIDGELPWGGQADCIGRSRVFVSPNPSPANAVFSLPDLVEWFNKLDALLAAGA